MTDTPDAILTKQRAELDRLRAAGGNLCDVDQAELLTTLIKIASLAVDLDVAMTAGRPAPVPWERAATRARTHGWDSPRSSVRPRPASR